MAESPTEPQVTKRRVTCTNSVYVGTTEDGQDIYQRAQMVDYVPDDVRDGVNVLQAYVDAARQGWASVVVGDEYDAGPAGYHGQTHIADGVHIPATDTDPPRFIPLQHPLAGQTFEATAPPPDDATAPPDDGGDDTPKGGRGGSSGASSLDTWTPPRIGRLGAFLAMQLGLGMLLLTVAALINTATRKNLLAQAYANDTVSFALYSTAPGAAAGTELTGGTPAYARITPTWGAPSNGVISTNAMTFNVASGSTVAGFGGYSTGAVYQDGASLTSQAFASQGTYALTVTYTQT